MPKHIYSIVSILAISVVGAIGMLFSSTLLAAQLIHHEILAQITPEKHEINIVDVVTLDEGRSLKQSSVTFLLHAGDAGKSPAIIEKNFRLERLSRVEFEQVYPAFMKNTGEHVETGSVPAVAYRVFIPEGENQFTLEYTLSINHAVRNDGEEYERSISESAGLILPKGVYLAGESLWYPRFDNELVNFRLSVRLPSGWKSVSQGKRLYVEDERTYHLDTWEEKKPQDDIYLIAAKFKEYSQAAGSVNAMAFLREPDDALAQKYLDVTAQYMEMYRELLGPYPYSKFALVENFWETGFGMPSFTLLGSQIIRFPFILHSSYPHELLHNWWGNSVYVDYVEGNWAEGLTAYLADHLIKEQKGRGVLHRRAVLQKYTNFTQAGGDFPLKSFVSRHNAVTEAVGYGKTLMLFHMLRQKLGDEVFASGLKTFYMKFRYKVAGYSDIEAVFSRVSETDLSSFFNDWVNRVGAPDLQLENVVVEKSMNGKFNLSADLIQKQSGDAYKLDVPIAISLSGEKFAIQRTIHMKEKNAAIKVSFDKRPTFMEVDPQFDLFRRLDLYETPPSLSQAFGAAESVIILSSNENTDLKDTYEGLAKSWKSSQSQNITIAYDSEFSELPSDKAIWIFGNNNKFKTEFVNTLKDYPISTQQGDISIGKNKLNAKTHSIVLVSRNPVSPKFAISFVSASQKNAIAGLGRKLPHYGKYSYLAFEGDAPTNFAKGQWPIINSPLSASLSTQPSEGKNKSSLAKREPLMKLAPVFSQKRMLNHIQILADKKMKGRGIGSPELDKAAEYIASEFKQIGLSTLTNMKEGNYFQSWTQPVEGIGSDVKLKNVIGVLPGSNPKYVGESVIVSAHYDHVGLGEVSARKENKGKIHFGADDNASGVAVMIELARLMKQKGAPERTIIFIAFTGEEVDKQGSKYYVKHASQYPTNKIMGVVNLDTVGRLGDNPLSIFSTHSASEWVHIFRGAGFVTGVNVKPIAKNIGASDDESFLDANVPAVHFFSGANVDFHKPTDTVNKIDAMGMVKVAAVLKETVDYLASREEPLTNNLTSDSHTAKGGGQKNANSDSKRTQRRVSLGTVPDFTFQGKGVRVSDVVKGSAAEKAGVVEGDVIVEINGSIILGLREFSQYLKKLNAGDTIYLTLQRGAEVVERKAVVTAR